MEITFKIKNPKSITIVYSDDSLLVIYKPALMHSVSQQDSHESVESFLLLGELVDTELPECGLLQRLDYVTAGVMLVARNRNIYDLLKKQSKDGLLEKEYEAVSSLGDVSFVPEGFLPSEWLRFSLKASWNVAIESRFVYREKGRQAVRLISKDSKSKNASAVYKTTIILQKISCDYFCFHVRLTRGYRHQVRATLSAIGFPIIGDTLYGGMEHETLHFKATAIKFYHPVLQQKYYLRWTDDINTNSNCL